ncbi:MAG: AbrB/MazE/SpoVT family DNA-binding domain-containing protein [Halobacteria archaeon]|nr:AbrB/MazE/SpoVT family DNA-binding domain-containing protein [Halobacteria archaeon]
MRKSERRNPEENEVVVSVTENGQATIPKKFRDKLGVDPPAKVLFRETDEGEIVVERVPSPGEMRGFAARNEEKTHKSATQLLREKRREDKQKRGE